MLRSAKALLIPALVSACALLLSACSGGSNSNNTKTSVITAEANIPSSVNAGVAFTVSISLTSTGSGGTASVQLIDVSTLASKIDCGGSQSVAIGGASTSFSCQAPQVSLGGNNAHQLQVDVNGVVNLSSPASVDVVNGGKVGVQLTSVSGTTITNAAPGQTVNVDFSTTTTPAGVGQYTVTAPSGWTVGNSGVCSVSGQSTTCTVPVTVATNAANGSYDLKLAPEDGSSPLSTTSLPISVVVNSGEVDVQLTDVFGTAITTTTPGQTIGVALTTTTTPAGVGQYTVTVPSGWTVGNSGVCSVSGQSPTCRIPVTVAANAASGSYDLSIAAGQGSSPLSATNLPISVQTQPPTSEMAFDLAQNISSTVYANLPSQTTTFTYQPIYLFKNTSSGSLSIDSVNVSGLTNVQYGCNIAAPNQQAEYTFSATPDCTLNSTGLYAVSGDLSNNFSTPPSSTASPVGSASISISVLGGGQTYVQNETTVVFAEYVPGHVAVRVVSNNGSTVYAAVVAGSNMVNFDPNHVGTASSDSSADDFQADQVALATNGGLLYMPYGASDVVNLTRGTGGFNTNGPPSPTGSPTPPSYLSIEMTYLQNLPGGSCSTSICEQLVVDQTYVNFISMLGSFNLMGNTAPLALDTEAATHGTVTDLTQPQIYQNIETFFNNQGSPWAYDSTRGTPPGQQNYIQNDAAGNITAILAPLQVYGTPFDPMQSNYYDTYVNALWTYLGNNPIYVSASGTGQSDFKTPAPADNCVLKGQVVTTVGSPNYGELVFSVSSAPGTCPAIGYAIGPAVYQGDYCGYTGSQPANLACGDTPNLVFAKFNECDFINAAGSNACHELVDPTSTNAQPQAIDPATFFDNQSLWGPNGTYRAVVGRAIAAYQAAGLLPPCADPSEIMNAGNARIDVDNGNGFSNPLCLPGLASAPPTWNVYTAGLRPYADVYAYSYGDFLGLDGTVTFSVNALPQTLYQNLQVAQPVTITLH